MQYISVCLLSDNYHATTVTKSPVVMNVASNTIRFSWFIQGDDCTNYQEVVTSFGKMKPQWPYHGMPNVCFFKFILLWSCPCGLPMETTMVPFKCMRHGIKPVVYVNVAYSICHGSMFMLTTLWPLHSAYEITSLLVSCPVSDMELGTCPD